MRTPGFWYQPPGLRAALLAPLAALYRGIARTRRRGTTPSRPVGVPVIVIGNVVAGGAGKTPVALALARLLKERGQAPVFVTRGYGGTEKGPLRVDPARHTAREVGDEALLLAAEAPCWIGRDRVAALRAAAEGATHLLLDDGLQNPRLAPDRALLVLDGPSGVGNGRLIPAGPLREPLEEALARTDATILIGDDAQGLAPCLTGKPVLGARLVPDVPESLPRDRRFLAFAGIERPGKFFACCRDAGLEPGATRAFADHHPYSAAELEALEAEAERLNLRLLTTAKDAARFPQSFRDRIAVLPIRLVFADPEAVLKLCL